MTQNHLSKAEFRHLLDTLCQCPTVKTPPHAVMRRHLCDAFDSAVDKRFELSDRLHGLELAAYAVVASAGDLSSIGWWRCFILSALLPGRFLRLVNAIAALGRRIA